MRRLIAAVFASALRERDWSPLRKTGQVLLWVMLLCTAPLTGTALATVLGNPAPEFLEGDLGLGARGSDYRETLFLDYGATDDATLQFLAGRVNFPGRRGVEFGAGLRYKIGPEFFANSAPTRLGVFGFWRWGSEDSDIGDMDFNLLDAGFGVSVMPSQHLVLFGSAIFRHMDINFRTEEPDENYESGSDLGAAFGVELWFTASFVIGLEIHTGLKDDNLAAYIEFKL